MFAFCHLLLTVFNNAGQKKLTETSVKKQSHDARDILRVSQSKPILFDFCLNLSVINSMKRQQGQTNSACEISQKPWKIRAWANLVPRAFFKGKALGTRSSLGLGFLARDKVKLKRLLSRLRLEFQSSCLNTYRLTISRQRSYCWSTSIRRHVKIRQ